jgi:hypothetical protein
LELPLDSPPNDPVRVLEETLHRLIRLESRVVQLMKHLGMTSDGRAPITDKE